MWLSFAPPRPENERGKQQRNKAGEKAVVPSRHSVMGREPSQHEIVTILGSHGRRPEVIQFYLKEFFECFFFNPLRSKYVHKIRCYAVVLDFSSSLISL